MWSLPAHILPLPPVPTCGMRAVAIFSCLCPPPCLRLPLLDGSPFDTTTLLPAPLPPLPATPLHLYTASPACLCPHHYDMVAPTCLCLPPLHLPASCCLPACCTTTTLLHLLPTHYPPTCSCFWLLPAQKLTYSYLLGKRQESGSASAQSQKLQLSPPTEATSLATPSPIPLPATCLCVLMELQATCACHLHTLPSGVELLTLSAYCTVSISMCKRVGQDSSLLHCLACLPASPAIFLPTTLPYCLWRR